MNKQKLFHTFIYILVAMIAPPVFAQASFSYLNDDPIYGTVGFKRSHWAPSIDSMLTFLAPGTNHYSVRSLNPTAVPGGHWTILWPDDLLGIKGRDNENSFFIPQLNELWIWDGAYLAMGVDSYSARFSLAGCAPAPSTNCAYPGGWIATGLDHETAFKDVVDMSATNNRMPYQGIDSAMAWATDANAGLLIGGSGDDGVSTFLFEPKAGGPELYKSTRLTISRPPYRSQCMNCLVSDGTDFYLMGGYTGGGSHEFNNRRDLWKFTLATRTWTELPPPPEIVYTPVLTYDSHRQVLLSWVFNRLYMYDIHLALWSNITPPNFLCVFNQTGVYSPTARKHLYQGGGTVGSGDCTATNLGQNGMAFRQIVAVDLANVTGGIVGDTVPPAVSVIFPLSGELISK
jgi:hypothetical protein